MIFNVLDFYREDDGRDSDGRPVITEALKRALLMGGSVRVPAGDFVLAPRGWKP